MESLTLNLLLTFPHSHDRPSQFKQEIMYKHRFADRLVENRDGIKSSQTCIEIFFSRTLTGIDLHSGIETRGSRRAAAPLKKNTEEARM